MIKRVRFATRRQGVRPEAFLAAWPQVVAGAAEAPPDVRPVRVAVCTALPEFTGRDPRHDGLGIEWFTDAVHLRRFHRWLDTGDGRALRQADGVIERAASPAVIADECVMRGADWLEKRWQDGGAKLKHMAIANRADGLSRAEFSKRWRGHAGRVRRPGEAQAAPIPDGARGRAYIQNHPRRRRTGEWAYDALNEVYFDDAESLRTRIDWFARNASGQGSDGLFRESWFMAVREEVVFNRE